MSSSSRPASLPLAPSPIQTILVDCEIGGGRYTGVHRVWRTPQARACRLCYECRALHAPGEGISTCVVPLVGGLADPSAAALVGVAADGRIAFGEDLGDRRR